MRVSYFGRLTSPKRNSPRLRIHPHPWVLPLVVVAWAITNLASTAQERTAKVALSFSKTGSGDAPNWKVALNGRPFELRDVPELPGASDIQDAEVLVFVGSRPETPNLADLAQSKRGLVVINDFAKAGSQVAECRSRFGGGIALAEARKWEGSVSLFFTPPGRTHPISTGFSNFEVPSGFTWNLTIDPAATVLATTWTPHQKKLKSGEPQPYVYGVTPVLWTLEKGGIRMVGIALDGTAMLKNPALCGLVARAIAWAAKREKLDDFCTPPELASFAYPPGGPLAPDAARNALKTHPDFDVDLIAAEPLISKPVNLDWDERGRLWVAESLEYPEGRKGGGPESMYAAWQRESDLKKPASTSRPGRDRVSWLEDANGDGQMDTKHVFANDLDMVTSLCFYKDGVIVAQPPEVLWLRDTDHDGKADRREVLYTGLGTSDTHAVLNNLRWGLDGWIYATHGYSSSPRVTSGDGSKNFGPVNSGVVRFRPDGSAFEMRTAKSGNCWGVDITSDGEIFFTQPTSGDLVMHAPIGDPLMAEGGLGREPSWNVMVHLRPVRPMMSQEEIIENQPNDVIGSFTAACGCAVYEGGKWPAEWARGYFTAEPTVHIVHHEVLTPRGVTFEANKARDEEFTATRDFWHRPIDTRVGPDGDLYVTDFYNQAILHNDPRGPIHLWNNQAARPDRDHFFGRIYRLRHKASQQLPKADLTTREGRIAALGHPNREVRFRAHRLLEDDSAQLSAAAADLTNASGVARLHALWLRSAANVLTVPEIRKSLASAELSERTTIARVLAEHPSLASDEVVAAVAKRLESETDAREKLLLLAAVPPSRPLPAALLVKLAASPDAWTKAAVIRNAKGQAGAVWAAAVASSTPSESLQPLVEALISLNRQDAKQLGAILDRLADTPKPRIALATAALQSLGTGGFANESSVRTSLNHLIESKSPSIFTAGLPLAVKLWNDAERKDRLPAAARKALAFAQDTRTTDSDRTAALAALARLPDISTDAAVALRRVIDQKPVREALIANPSSQAAALLLDSLATISPAAKAQAVESLLSRRDSALALLSSLESKQLSLIVAGPAVLSRLQDHPDQAVKDKARQVSTMLRGAVEARDAIVDRLLPTVSKPGNTEAGKVAFAACAVCHQFQGQGAAVGPVLDGIGIHTPEVLLTHIIDPNREVEPSFLTWNVTTKTGETTVGIISRETAGSLFLKNAGGEVEVKRSTIASQTNTGLSLMPEGFEALPPETLRDLIAYLQSGSSRYHAIPFGVAATADGSRGVYLARDVEIDRVNLRKYGIAEFEGVRFSLPDPASLASGKNVIVLKGGAEGRAVSQTMPSSVELPVHLAAGRLHLLGAVAGWGWPATDAKDPLIKITIHYEGGEKEDIELRNGVDIADHAGPVDVPGSARTDLTSRGQMRYLWRDLTYPGRLVDHFTLTSFARRPAPMIAALTMESVGSNGKLLPPPKSGGASAAAR